MARELREVVFVDGVRTAFGKAGPGGYFWKTRADDMAVKAVRELLRRNPEVPAERIGDVIFAATAQVGDQGLTLGRDVALLAGLPHTVPGFAVDRMCAGALTATTAGAGEIAMGAADIVLVGGVEHMGHHEMGAEVDFNPRFVSERMIDESAAVMGQTAENLHDAFPQLTKEAADRYAVESQRRASAAWGEQDGVMAHTVVPMSVFGERRLDASPIATSSCGRTPRSKVSPRCGRRSVPAAGSPRETPRGSRTAPPPACSRRRAWRPSSGSSPRCGSSALPMPGVEPHLMGLGPVPATERVLAQAGITVDDIGLFELNEPFAVQVLTWCDGVGVAPDDPRLNPHGGAIACGHPLAATGVRLMAQLAYELKRRPGRPLRAHGALHRSRDGRGAPVGEHAAWLTPRPGSSCGRSRRASAHSRS